MNEAQVIVVGGGASGLLAARLLSARYKVTLLEYRQQTGGRIRTQSWESGPGHYEAGAEFVHGDLPVTMSLLKEAGLSYISSDGAMLRKKAGRWIEQDEMIEGWDKLIAQMKKLDSDTTLQQFLDRYYPGEGNAAFRGHINQFAQGFDLADPVTASVQALCREWSAEMQNHRITEGYSALMDFLEKECIRNGCEIITGDAVRQINWDLDNVVALTASGKIWRGKKVIVSIPVSLYADMSGPCSINFTPPVDEYIAASRKIGFGTVVKIIIRFREPLWKTGTAFILSDETIPTWWTQHPEDDRSLTGWAGGANAERICQHSDEEILTHAINSLSAIFDAPADAIRNNISEYHVFNWKDYPEIRGAYSFSTTESKLARQILKQPLKGSLYFVGEALYEGEHAGTVEAAFISGRAAAEAILKG